MTSIPIDSIIDNNEQASVLKEIANLTANAAASALSAMLGQNFNTGMPTVLAFDTAESAIGELIGTTGGLASVSMSTQVTTEMLFAMNAENAIALSNTMMGMPADAGLGEPLSEIQLSAFGEAISQMMGASGNGLSAFLAKTVDFTTPQTGILGQASLSALAPEVAKSQVIVLVYELVGDGGLSSLKLLQIFNDTQVKEFVSKTMATTQEESIPNPPSASGADPKVTVQPVQFAPLTPMPEGFDINNLGLVRDIQLNLSVELGRSEITIKDVLELARGSVIELDRIAGEPVDLLANGKLIAKGEVVVIEDNFGFRVTQIVSPSERMAAV